MRHAGLPQGGESRERARAARFARGFSWLLALAYALMVFGALVRAHGAGLACPDWPLCFGELVPRFDFRIAFEWGHRLIAGSVSLIFAALALGITNDPALRRIAGRPLLVATALLGLQIVLGGLTVLHFLASWTVTAHLVTGNGFALTLLLLVLRLRDHAAGSAAAPEPIAPALRTLVMASALLLTAEIVLGGLVSSRYAGLACSEWPACRDGAFFPTFEGAVGLHLLHRLNAYLLVGLLAWTAWTARGVCGLERPTALALVLVLVQACLGAGNVLLRIPVEITALHTATAIALVLTTTFCVRAAWLRPLRAVDAAPSREPAQARR